MDRSASDGWGSPRRLALLGRDFVADWSEDSRRIFIALIRFDVPGRDAFRAQFDVSAGRIYFTMTDNQSDLYMAELR
jgi:hypothetical protein